MNLKKLIGNKVFDSSKRIKDADDVMFGRIKRAQSFSDYINIHKLQDMVNGLRNISTNLIIQFKKPVSINGSVKNIMAGLVWYDMMRYQVHWVDKNGRYVKSQVCKSVDEVTDLIVEGEKSADGIYIGYIDN